MDNVFALKILWQWLAPTACSRATRARYLQSGNALIDLQFLELKFELLDLSIQLLGTASILLLLELGDEQLQVLDLNGTLAELVDELRHTLALNGKGLFSGKKFSIPSDDHRLQGDGIIGQGREIG